MDKINFIVKDSELTSFNLGGEGTIKVYPPLDDLEVIPSKEVQTFKNQSNYGYNNITVNPIPDEYIKPSGTLTINENGIKDVAEVSNVIVSVPVPSDYIKPSGTLNITNNGVKDVHSFSKVDVNVKPELKLQSKEVIPTKEEQTITNDSEYDGLNSVKVNAIPDEYIIPDGTLPITENATFDVRSYARVSTSVHPAPNLQDKSVNIVENGTLSVSADEGFDGLSSVEVNVEVEATGIPKQTGTQSLINTINSVFTEFKNSLNEVINTYTPYCDTSVTLYTPDSSYKYYLINHTYSGYTIHWIATNMAVTYTGNTISLRNLTVTISNSTLYPNVTTTANISRANAKQTNYYSQTYGTLEECLQAIQSPYTTYTSVSANGWATASENEFDGIITNLPMVNNSNFIKVRRVSLNETIQVI